MSAGTRTPRPPSAPTPTGAELSRVVVIDLDTLRALIREAIAEMRPGAPAPDFYSQGCLPPGMTRRAFLDAIRRGDLPARAAGKARLVAREDYLAFVGQAPSARGGRRSQPTPPTTSAPWRGALRRTHGDP